MVAPILDPFQLSVVVQGSIVLRIVNRWFLKRRTRFLRVKFPPSVVRWQLEIDEYSVFFMWWPDVLIQSARPASEVKLIWKLAFPIGQREVLNNKSNNKRKRDKKESRTIDKESLAVAVYWYALLGSSLSSAEVDWVRRVTDQYLSAKRERLQLRSNVTPAVRRPTRASQTSFKAGKITYNFANVCQYLQVFGGLVLSCIETDFWN